MAGAVYNDTNPALLCLPSKSVFVFIHLAVHNLRPVRRFTCLCTSAAVYKRGNLYSIRRILGNNDLCSFFRCYKLHVENRKKRGIAPLFFDFNNI